MKNLKKFEFFCNESLSFGDKLNKNDIAQLLAMAIIDL